jgi:choline dehydrogenase-like flavoprotein
LAERWPSNWPGYCPAWSRTWSLSTPCTTSEQLGLPVSGDLNGADRTGFGIAPANIRDGVRHSVVDGYLRPALGRPNLAVRTGTPVAQVLFNGRKATGVRLRADPLLAPACFLQHRIGQPKHLAPL